MMKAKTFYYWLDPIRALAAILVLICHTRFVVFSPYNQMDEIYHNWITTGFFTLCSLGGFSVCLFYLLSGFLIGGQTINRINGGNEDPIKFAINRIFRIGVPLTGAIVLTFLTNCFLGIDNNIVDIFGQYLGLQVILVEDYGGVFWTLTYEIWFYALMFAILCFHRKSKVILGLIIFTCSLIVFAQLSPKFLYVIAIGVLCYFLKDIRFNNILRICLVVLFITQFVAYLIATIHSIPSCFKDLILLKHYSSSIQITLFIVIAAIISQYVLKKPKLYISIKINKYGRKLAVFSYSLFLTHYQILKLWTHFGERIPEISMYSISVFIGLCLISILVAYIFYLLIEKNTSKIQNFILRKLRIYR